MVAPHLHNSDRRRYQIISQLALRRGHRRSRRSPDLHGAAEHAVQERRWPVKRETNSRSRTKISRRDLSESVARTALFMR